MYEQGTECNEYTLLGCIVTSEIAEGADVVVEELAGGVHDYPTPVDPIRYIHHGNNLSIFAFGS
jgi:hypothetical protein